MITSRPSNLNTTIVHDLLIIVWAKAPNSIRCILYHIFPISLAPPQHHGWKSFITAISFMSLWFLFKWIDTFKDHSHTKQPRSAYNLPMYQGLILDFLFRGHPRYPRRYVLEPSTDMTRKSSVNHLQLIYTFKENLTWRHSVSTPWHYYPTCQDEILRGDDKSRQG